MSILPYHKRYHGDALTGFMPLTLEERGAYQTLLDMMYDRGGPLIDNERLLAGYMNCSVRKWRSLRAILIEKGKIHVTDDGLIGNDRAQKEIENTAKTSRKLSECGAKGGRTRAENEKKDKENNEGEQANHKEGLSNPQAIPEARSQKDSEANASGASADPAKQMFDLGVELLVAHGQTEKQARSLIGKWRKPPGTDGEVLTALLDCRARAISNPVEWLEKRFGGASEYVSKSGFRYRGDADTVLREAQRRNDMDTYWRVKGDLNRQSQSAATTG